MEVTEYHENISDKKEIDALNQFKNTLATITDKKNKEVITPTVLLNDDLLIHFLRARKLNVKKATKMILDYLHWATKTNLDNLLNFKLEKKYVLESYFPHGFHKTTKEGNPVYIQIMGFLNPENLFKEISSDDLNTYSTQIYQRLENDLFPLCSTFAKKYIHGCFNIMDFKGINKSILNKKLIAYLKQNMKICQDFYPESLAGCLVINAGLIFRALYSTCKVFLDSKTKQKIKVYGNKYQNVLLEIISEENLPSFFGGKCQCPGGCIFSGEGPWKKTDDPVETVPDEVIKRRNEINDILLNGKLTVNKEDEIKDPKQQSNGVSGEEL